MRKIFTLIIFFLPFTLSAQLIARSLTAANGELVGFYEFRPDDYATSPDKHPVIIFLHGVGEKGNGTTELVDVQCCGIPSYIRRGNKMRFTWNGKTESFVVLYPQLNTKYAVWENFYTEELIKYATNNLRIDPDRIFLTGLSLGGGGTWAYASSSQGNAEKFAGIAPVVAPCFMSNGCNIAKADLPVLAIHALDDVDASPSCTINALKSINDCQPGVTPNLIMYPSGGHYVWVKNAFDTAYNYQNPNMYEWMLAQNRKFAPNKKPLAKAGADIAVATSKGSAALDAGGSSDPDGVILRYAWRKIAGPSSGTLSNSASAAATVTGLAIAGSYSYEVKVVDDKAEWTLDTVIVRVTADGTLPNLPPLAVAGGDITLIAPASSAALNAGGSSDPDGSITSYEWSQVSGTVSVTITSPNSASATVGGLVQGTYTFRVTIKDNKGATATDDVIVTVNPEGTTPPPVPGNTPPVARAGADQTIKLSYTAKALINGTTSTDPGGWIKAFAWSKLSGPAAGLIETPAAGKSTVSGLVEGIYTFRLTVTDNLGATAVDDVVITASGSGATTPPPVTPPPAPGNTPPVARAGADQTIKLSYATRALINGTTSTDPDGWVKSFGWEKVSGPSSFSFENAGAGKTFVNNLTEGTYIFRLTVTDNLNAVSTDDVAVTMTGGVAVNSISGFQSSYETGVNTEKIAVYPNPSVSYAYLQYNSGAIGKSTLRIYDLSGKLVRKVDFEKSSSNYRLRLDISGLPPGLYLFDVITGDTLRLHSKFVKQ